ncbi:NfeD family protein [Romboutsia sp. 13368]|uniref:NfeD family protein n=1 Tax=Romboutsia sp. 13368 TaxID=2708053 RepID=UPI0025FB8847|nr:NfeD family protein [Romboutsia sp. 13368]
MKLVWLVVAILFAIGELMTTTLTLIWFSIGAIILIFLSNIIDSILIQIIIFSIISTSMLIIATKKFIKQDKNYKYNTNLQAIINKQGIVKETIYPNKIGIVIIEGETWSAISYNNEIIEKEEIVEVLKIEGVKVVVKKIN